MAEQRDDLPVILRQVEGRQRNQGKSVTRGKLLLDFRAVTR
jgi:hypothetical protein